MFVLLDDKWYRVSFNTLYTLYSTLLHSLLVVYVGAHFFAGRFPFIAALILCVVCFTKTINTLCRYNKIKRQNTNNLRHHHHP